MPCIKDVKSMSELQWTLLIYTYLIEARRYIKNNACYKALLKDHFLA